MQELNLPNFNFNTKKENGKVYIFDEIRKKYLLLTPEEWVRQHFVKYLIQEKNYPASLIVLEKGLKLNELTKRADVLIYKDSFPVALVECKAPNVKISQNTFDQIARYNLVFKVPYLIVTNGMNHYCASIDFQNQTFNFIKEIPTFENL